ncbi:Scr1 family TA system antitoxin-like transcriptional regulator [Streptomyces zagrosensis]
MLPVGSSRHGWVCPFGVLSLAEGRRVAHVDGFPRGFVLAEEDDVREACDAYDQLSAMSASPNDSVGLLDAIIKEDFG